MSFGAPINYNSYISQSRLIKYGSVFLEESVMEKFLHENARLSFEMRTVPDGFSVQHFLILLSHNVVVEFFRGEFLIPN